MIDSDFVEKGLTLEEAYILGRVRSFESNGLVYYESNKKIAKEMGKSESTVIRAINNLILKGYLNKRTGKRRRSLSLSNSIEPCHSDSLLDSHTDILLDSHIDNKEDEPKEVNKMSREKALQYALNKIQQNKNKIYKNADEDYY